MALSLGTAWDETRALLRRDGGLVATVALALLVLPGTIAGLIVPVGTSQEDAGAVASLVMLVSTLIGLAGQLAISRIALGPSTTVGGAIATGFRRLPILFSAMLLVVVPAMLLMLVPLLIAGGGTLPKTPPPALGIPILLLLPVLIYVLLRLLFVTPAAADTTIGPVALLKRGWALSRGRVWKLLGLIGLVILGGLVLVVGLGGALGAVTILALGAPEPGNVSALLVALAQQLLNAVVASVFSVMLARLYVQAQGGETAMTATVPHAGGE